MEVPEVVHTLFSIQTLQFQHYHYSETHMLMTIAVLLLILWALGLVSSYTIGGLIHVLLVVAIIIILVRIIQGRNPLP